MAFKGILNEHSPKFSVITSEDPRMGLVGMGSYNVKSLTKVLNDKESQKEIVSALVDPCLPGEKDRERSELQSIADNLKKAFIADDPGIEMYYYKFDQTKNKYVKAIFADSLEELMNYWDKSQKDSTHINTNLTFKTTIRDIRNSLEGCLVFEPRYGGTQFRKSRVFFRSINNYDDSREMVINGDPKISAIPRRPTGAKYDFARTQHIQLSGIDNTNDENKQYGHIGRYRKNSNNAEISDQSVVSKLRLSYNKSLGYFESGTQSVIARLLDDLPSPPLKDINLDNADSIKFSDMYDVDANAFFGGFTTGFALPLTVHNGNPNTFGPNVIGNKNQYKKERIRVVNRANASFSTGDIVMCSLIDNEWIVQGFGGSPAELEEVTFSSGKWSFIKMIADSDAYFRDDKWYSNGGQPQDNQYYRQDTYGTLLRQQFYFDLNNHYSTDESFTLAGINDVTLLSKLNAIILNTVDEIILDNSLVDNLSNLENLNITPSRRYVQSTIFDQLGIHMGGNNTIGNVVGRTNWRNNPDTSQTFGRDLAEKATEVPLFWGPVFPDGYNTSQARRLVTQTIISNPVGNVEFFGPPTTLDIISIKDTDNRHGNPKTYMFANQRDFSLSQLPAEVGLNASPSGEYGYPIESISLLGKIESENAGNLVNTFKTYINHDSRLSWLANSGNKNTSIYDLKPNTTTQLDFIPLSFAMAGNSDKASTIQEYQGYNTFDMARSILQPDLADTPHLWGNMLQREKLLTSHEFLAKPGLGITSEILDKANFTNGLNLPWDKYIKNNAYNGPDATPYFFSEGVNGGSEGANLVGIVAAKNTFSMNAGGTINFETDYYIGLNGKNSVTGSAGNISVIPTIPPVTFGTGPTIRTFSIVQWGTRDTRPIAMGHTSLYVKVFDHWPEKQTIYDARYYTPLYFCAGDLGSSASSISITADQYSGEWDVNLPASGYNTGELSNINYPRTVDEISHDIDFRVPTYGNPINDQIDNEIIPVNIKIDQYGTIEPRQALRRQDEWRVNTICRGMMVSPEGGFKYYRRTIGLDISNITKIDSGNGFAIDDEIVVDQEKSIKIKVTATGDEGSIAEFILLDKGKDLFTTDFNREYTPVDNSGESLETISGYLLTIKSEVGKDASYMIHNGIIYDRIESTNYPKQHGSMLTLTPSSQDGSSGPIFGRKVSSLTIQEPSEDSLYDAFYYHVNDVTHVDLFSAFSDSPIYNFARRGTNTEHYVDQSNGNLQRVSLNISAT